MPAPSNRSAMLQTWWLKPGPTNCPNRWPWANRRHMKILVTGGAGFIGSNFIRQALLQSKQLEIVNFDKLTYSGNLENLADLAEGPRYQFLRGDIADARAVAEV